MEDIIACFVQTVRWRNIGETLTAIALLTLIGFGLLVEPHPELEIAGRLVIILASLGILGVIWSRLYIPASEVGTYPPAQNPDRWRRHMNTQARWLRFAWLWYVLPLFVGIALMMLGSSGAFSIEDAVAILVVATLAVGIGVLNVKASKQVERNRDAWLGGKSTT